MQSGGEEEECVVSPGGDTLRHESLFLASHFQPFLIFWFKAADKQNSTSFDSRSSFSVCICKHACVCIISEQHIVCAHWAHQINIHHVGSNLHDNIQDKIQKRTNHTAQESCPNRYTTGVTWPPWKWYRSGSGWGEVNTIRITYLIICII